MIPAAKAKLLEGKKGLIVGIANDQSIAWGCAKAFRAFGAELAVTYLNDKAKKYVEPLAQELEAKIVLPLDVRAPGEMEAVFERIAQDWGKLDFVVHSIAFSPKDALQGRVVDVSRDGHVALPDPTRRRGPGRHLYRALASCLDDTKNSAAHAQLAELRVPRGALRNVGSPSMLS